MHREREVSTFTEERVSIPLSGRSPVRPPAGHLLSQGQIESEILRLSDALEEQTNELARRLEAAAEAEVAWKQAEAIALLRSAMRSEHQRKAEALTINAEQHRAFRISDARSSATTEICRTLRAQLDSLRTLAANVRSQS